MAKKIILQRYNIMVIFILTVHSVSPILIRTVTLITLRSYSVLASDCYLPTTPTM
jgi:hypothetical protein